MTAERYEIEHRSQRRPIRVGISACLLGQHVRFDGSHKRNGFLTESFGDFVEWVPVCPEVECGLGTPREAMRLVRSGGIRLVTTKSGIDLTVRMQQFAQSRLANLAGEELSGYVLKKDSPTCGLERVKVYGRGSVPTRNGHGLFAAALVAAFPNLPVEEEGRLADPRLRDNFVERVFAYWRLRGLFARRWTIGDLVRFHTAHKLMLLAHSPNAYRELGRLVAGASGKQRGELKRSYETVFMRALAQPATTSLHTNVLQHVAGHFKELLDSPSKHELGEVIDDYRRGLVPLNVPLTLVRHYVRRFAVSYLSEQLYLQPHPKELMLRNYV